jgi:hypothetical protein
MALDPLYGSGGLGVSATSMAVEVGELNFKPDQNPVVVQLR